MTMAYKKTYSKQLGLLVNEKLSAYEYSLKISAVVDRVENIRQGVLFIAKQGNLFNPLSKIDDVLAKKPTAILCQKDNEALHDLLIQKISNKRILLIIVENIQLAVVFALQNFYKEQIEKLHLVGVTGTDGKSSVAMLFAMMNPEQTGVVGTLGYGRVNNIKYTGMTTPSIVALYAMLCEMVDKRLTTVVMEVSSHAIEQQRIGGLKFDVAVITNLGSDHLDFHKSLDHYHNCKKSFIRSDSVAISVVNIDDPNLKTGLGNVDISFADLESLCIKKIDYVNEGLTIHFIKQEFDTLILNLYGKFNVYNILSVLAIYKQLGYSFSDVYNMLKNIVCVEGRMERIADSKGRFIFVDFAHTANGLKNSLEAIMQHFKTKLILVFGCGGDRDTSKRQEMGQIAEQLADKVIVTNDNPRSESPEEIVAQILAGMNNPEEVDVILDRKDAIRRALQICQKDEVLLVAGKGHERTQINANGVIDFHDATVINSILVSAK